MFEADNISLETQLKSRLARFFATSTASNAVVLVALLPRSGDKNNSDEEWQKRRNKFDEVLEKQQFNRALSEICVGGGHKSIRVEDAFPSGIDVNKCIEGALCADARVPMMRIASMARLVLTQVATEQALHSAPTATPVGSVDARTATAAIARTMYLSLKRQEKAIAVQAKRLGSTESAGANEWELFSHSRSALVDGDPHSFIEGTAVGGLQWHSLNTAQLFAAMGVKNADSDAYMDHVSRSRVLAALANDPEQAYLRPADMIQQVQERDERMASERGGARDGLYKSVMLLPLSRSAMCDAYGIADVVSPLLCDAIPPTKGKTPPMLVMIFDEMGRAMPLGGVPCSPYVGLTTDATELTCQLLMADGVSDNGAAIQRGERSCVQIITHELEKEFSIL